MQLEQEYEEKQMVLHEKHDLEGLIATLCEQVGGRGLGGQAHATGIYTVILWPVIPDRASQRGLSHGRRMAQCQEVASQQVAPIPVPTTR